MTTIELMEALLRSLQVNGDSRLYWERDDDIGIRLVAEDETTPVSDWILIAKTA